MQNQSRERERSWNSNSRKKQLVIFRHIIFLSSLLWNTDCSHSILNNMAPAHSEISA